MLAPMKTQATRQIVALADALSAATERTRGSISIAIFDDHSRIDGLAAGRDLTTASAERALNWFAANWPEGLDWPESIPRPDPAASALIADELPRPRRTGTALSQAVPGGEGGR